jgi:hypothetical protein
MCDQRNHEQHQENEKQQLGYSRGRNRHSGKPQYSGDQSDDEKNDGPVEHDALLLTNRPALKKLMLAGGGQNPVLLVIAILNSCKFSSKEGEQVPSLPVKQHLLDGGVCRVGLKPN